MTGDAATVAEYLAGLPADRRVAIAEVRAVILKHLPPGYEEGICAGLICYYVPHRLFPAGHRLAPDQPLPYAYLGSRAKHMSLYLLCIYRGGGPSRVWLEQAYRESGKRFEMGRECIPFKRLDDLPLDVIGQAFARMPVDKYIASYVEMLGQIKSRRRH